MISCPYPGCNFEAKNNAGLAAHTRLKHPSTPSEQNREKGVEGVKAESKNPKSDITIKELPEKKVEDIVLEGEEEEEGEGEGEEGEEEEGEEEEEAYDMDYAQEDVDNLCEMLLGLPALVLGDHLIRTKEQIKPFARQLYLYCQKKDINPMEYFFDELGLVLAGGVLVKGMYSDHLEFEAKQKKEKKDEKEREESN